MKTRVLSAAVLLPVLLVIVLALPAWGTAVLFAAACALGAYELLYRTKLVQETRLVVYAMAAAWRAENGMTSLYDMEDVR